MNLKLSRCWIMWVTEKSAWFIFLLPPLSLTCIKFHFIINKNITAILRRLIFLWFLRHTTNNARYRTYVREGISVLYVTGNFQIIVVIMKLASAEPDFWGGQVFAFCNFYLIFCKMNILPILRQVCTHVYWVAANFRSCTWHLFWWIQKQVHVCIIVDTLCMTWI